MADLEPCPGCGAAFDPTDGPTHAYLPASAACWAAYGDVLAREYTDPALFQQSHRLTVDAYALQHVGDMADRRLVQSVWIHLASLHAVFDLGFPHDRATRMLGRLAGQDFGKPALPTNLGALTVKHVLAGPLGEHHERVEAWARTAYASWAHLHGDVAAAVKRFMDG